MNNKIDSHISDSVCCPFLIVLECGDCKSGHPCCSAGESIIPISNNTVIKQCLSDYKKCINYETQEKSDDNLEFA